MPRRRNGSRKSGRAAMTEGGRSQPAFAFLLDQFCDLLRRSSKRDRELWLREHAREWYRRLPRTGLWNAGR